MPDLHEPRSIYIYVYSVWRSPFLESGGNPCPSRCRWPNNGELLAKFLENSISSQRRYSLSACEVGATRVGLTVFRVASGISSSCWCKLTCSLTAKLAADKLQPCLTPSVAAALLISDQATIQRQRQVADLSTNYERSLDDCEWEF